MSHLGYKVNVVGWWPSHPAEPINGVMVSNHFHKIEKHELLPNMVHPSTQLDAIADLRVTMEEIGWAHLLPIMPNAHLVNQDEDNALAYLRAQIAHSTALQSVTTHLMQQTEWDVTAVYFEAIDRLCHRFMKYHPPLQEHIPEDKYNLYKKVVAGLHFSLVVAGLPFLLSFLLTAQKRLKELVSGLVYFSDPAKRLKLRLLSIYWHFLDGLWLYLLLFFPVNYWLR